MDSLEMRKLAEQVRDQLQARYKHTDRDWVDMAISPDGAAMLTIVSNAFHGQSNNQREESVQAVWSAIANNNLEITWMTLVTPSEAEAMAITPPHTTTGFVGSWLDFAHAVLNVSTQSSERLPDKTRVIVFYSYKGGVGRTTAMIHVAYLLARQGRKIALVDMDLEAPGLRHVVERLEPDPDKGLVNYLYERQLLSAEMKPTILIEDIVGKVKSSLAMHGELYIVPAGRVDLNYISIVDDLDTRVGSSGPQAWHGFIQELTDLLEPDLIFIDSRTGFNRWGAISLLLLADEAFVFGHPNRQNLEGLIPLLTALRGFGRPPLTVVLSMIPRTQEGEQLIEQAWARLAPLLPLPDDPSNQGKPTARGRPVVVYYNSTVATASHLPIASADAYRPLAARLDDIVEEAAHIQSLSVETGMNIDTDRRWDLVKAIHVPAPFAEQTFNPQLFQPIVMLDEIIRPKTVLIRGRKGTGKSYLFQMFRSRDEKLFKRESLHRVWMLPGHGKGAFNITDSALQRVAEEIGKKSEITWESFWVAHSLMQIWIGWKDKDAIEYGPPLPLEDREFETCRLILRSIPRGRARNSEWTAVHTDTVLKLAASPACHTYVDLFEWIEAVLLRGKHKQSIWVLYDNLEYGLSDWHKFWSAALVGLFQFIKSISERRISWFRHKVFLREDLWQRLQFTNKTHFDDRQVEIRWQRIDLLRLVYRLLNHNKSIAEFLEQNYHIQDLDRTDEEILINALGLIWGLRLAPSANAPRVYDWLYNRMTDAQGISYPREMIHILAEARNAELGFRSQNNMPPDRLLRREALLAGVLNASKKRCQALSDDEYRELKPFFAKLRGFPSRGDVESIRNLWNKLDIRYTEQDFEDFLILLETIGLIKIDRTRPQARRYAFANIYIDGFGLRRPKIVSKT